MRAVVQTFVDVENDGIPANSRKRRFPWLLIAAVALGVGCRLAQYAMDRSFWVDEASLVLNIRAKTASQLAGPLDYAQAAPPLFLLIERGIFKLLGGGEMSLRIFPVAGGIAAVFFFALLARRVVPVALPMAAAQGWVLLAVFLFAASDRLIARSCEVKPYGIDVLVCVVMLLLATDAQGRWPPLRRMLWLTIAATLAVWISFPAVLVFTALSLVLLGEIARERGRSGIVGWALLNLPVALSFGGMFLTTRESRNNGVLVDYWQDSFVDWHHVWDVPLWLARRCNGLCDYAFPGAGVVLLVAAVVGGVALFRSRHRALLGMLGGPIAVALLAAAAHRYPFDGARLTVFLTPGVILLAIIGLGALYHALASRIRYVALVPALYVAIIAAFWAGLHLVVPRDRSHLRPVAAFVLARAQPSDTIYASDLAPFLCYWPAGDGHVRRFLDRADQIPTRRFWVVWSGSGGKIQERTDRMQRWVRQFCVAKDQIITDGGAAILFERLDGKMPDQLESPHYGDEPALWRAQLLAAPARK